MDCSSPYAMASLIRLKDRFDIAFGNDTDVDRHGIVTRGAGLMNPNHYLSAAIWYLFRNRPGWRRDAAIGKTLVSTSMIDRVGAELGRRVCEVPVGFKWFVDGLLDGSFGFGGEESAGASFLRRDGTVWTTDKDGIIMDLLACEMTAKTGKDPAELYRELEDRFGSPFYERIDAPATPEQKAVLKKLSPELVTAQELAGEPITAKLTRAPGNNAEIGGLKVMTQNGWFAARPSGTEDIYKIYAESFLGEEHLQKIQEEAVAIVSAAFAAAGVLRFAPLTRNEISGGIMKKIVLLRHGESTWNRENRFTGWTDVPLSEKGVQEAREAGRLLREGGFTFDIAFTSVLKRAIKTLWLVLEEMDLMWIPVTKSWRLNERHYGALQGLNKSEAAAELGEEQVKLWRRSFDVPPPALTPDDPRHPRHDPRYADLHPEDLPATECLKDTIDRFLPYAQENIGPAVRSGRSVLVVAHGNTLRGLIKYAERISDTEIADLNIPTAIPLVYEFEDDMKPIRRYYLGDQESVIKAAESVAKQAER